MACSRFFSISIFVILFSFNIITARINKKVLNTEDIEEPYVSLNDEQRYNSYEDDSQKSVAIILLNDDSLADLEDELNSSDDKISSEVSTLESRDSDTSLDLEVNDDNILRSMWKSCSRKAAKQCTKACKSAYKTTCSEYKCKSSMKRSFKKECRYSCKSHFNKD